MSNRFKFRVWDNKHKTIGRVIGWSKYELIEEKENVVYCVGDKTSLQQVDSDRITIMQSTGLHDKNGVEIFEGDILFHKLQGKRVVYYPFNESTASFGLKRIANGFKNTLQDADRLYEVIGNIHENPELLECKQ